MSEEGKASPAAEKHEDAGQEPKKRAAKKMKGFNFPVDTDPIAKEEYANVSSFFKNAGDADWKILSDLVHDAQARKIDEPVSRFAYDKRRIKTAAARIVEIACSMVDGREDFENDVHQAADEKVEEARKKLADAEADASEWHKSMINALRENETLRAQANEREAWEELANERKAKIDELTHQLDEASERIAGLESLAEQRENERAMAAQLRDQYLAERNKANERAEELEETARDYKRQLEETAAQRDNYLKELDEANKRIAELEEQL